MYKNVSALFFTILKAISVFLGTISFLEKLTKILKGVILQNIWQ